MTLARLEDDPGNRIERKRRVIEDVLAKSDAVIHPQVISGFHPHGRAVTVVAALT
jgi:hypothetical protein